MSYILEIIAIITIGAITPITIKTYCNNHNIILNASGFNYLRLIIGRLWLPLLLLMVVGIIAYLIAMYIYLRKLLQVINVYFIFKYSTNEEECLKQYKKFTNTLIDLAYTGDASNAMKPLKELLIGIILEDPIELDDIVTATEYYIDKINDCYYNFIDIPLFTLYFLLGFIPMILLIF